MKFVVKNLGPLEHAELELGDFTIVCGKNNTGKSYLLNLVHGLLHSWNEDASQILKDSQINELFTSKLVEVDFSTWLTAPFLERTIQQFTEENLIDCMKDLYPSSHQLLIDNLEVTIQVQPQDLERLKKALLLFFQTTHKQGGSKLSVQLNQASKEKSDLAYTIRIRCKDEQQPYVWIFELDRPNSKDLSPSATFFIKHSILESLDSFLKRHLFQHILPAPRFSTSERTGLFMFTPELNFRRNQLVHWMASGKADNKKDLIEELLTNDPNKRYSLPIRQSVYFVQNILEFEQRIQSSEHELSDTLQQLLEMLAGGKILVSKSGQILFSPSKSKKKFSLTESASATRAIAEIHFYTRFIFSQTLKDNHILLIDEPEMNLHPHNQRVMARFLAALVNAGLRVVISTHSDYLIRELNLLLALGTNRDKPSIQAFLSKQDDFLPELLLTDAQLSLNMIVPISKRSKTNKLERVSPSKTTGAFNIASFNEVIREQNNLDDEVTTAIFGGAFS